MMGVLLTVLVLTAPVPMAPVLMALMVTAVVTAVVTAAVTAAVTAVAPNHNRP
ncbi:hypothetical protein [Burkholderia pseudomultivorans]|uniref:hypothetical protein n=1 Tax=Burkholderia pseudomultivorans TaxID=1207504 RepID=UPI000A6E8129|nr:hypothetical protein [Burkholderia pseudomultivorans]